MIVEDHEGLDNARQPVCIVGAGPVGISLAVRLAELGVASLLLESGGRKADPAVQALSAAEIQFPDAHDSMDIAVARRLGGTSNLWGGRCVPLDDIDFSTRQGVVDVRWPIAAADIEPFYARACDFTDSGPAEFVKPAPDLPTAAAGFRLDMLERWSGTPQLQRLHHQVLATSPLIDVRLNTVVVGMDFTASGAVQSLRIVRPDGAGHRTLPVRNVVIATGGIEAARLLLAIQRRRPSMFGGPDGPLGRFHMAHVMGAIADVRFANDVIDAAFDFEIDAGGFYVRRRFLPTADLQLGEGLMNCALWPIVPPIADAAHGSGPLSAIYLGLAFGPIGRMLIPEALRSRHVPPTPGPLGPHLLNVIRDMPTTIPYILSFMKKRYLDKRRVPGFYLRNPNRFYGLCYHSEQWPNPESRITLSEATDRTGLPRAKLGFRFDHRDAASIVRTHDAFAGWMERTGLGEMVHRHPPAEREAAVLRQAKQGPHQIGMTRMGFTERDGVVDGDLRTFSAPNLFVASCGVLPTSSQATPTLTAIALALRLAERLAADSSQGAPTISAAVGV